MYQTSVWLPSKREKTILPGSPTGNEARLEPAPAGSDAATVTTAAAIGGTDAADSRLCESP